MDLYWSNCWSNGSVASVFHLNVENASNWLQRNQSRSTAAANDSEDLSDIDDAEVCNISFFKIAIGAQSSEWCKQKGNEAGLIPIKELGCATWLKEL